MLYVEVGRMGERGMLGSVIKLASLSEEQFNLNDGASEGTCNVCAL